MLKFSDFIQKFDMYPAPITLRYNNTSHTRSTCSGMISFLALCLVLGYFIYNIVDVATSSETVVNIRYHETVANQTYAYSMPMVGISVDGLNSTEFNKRFDLEFMPKKKRSIFDTMQKKTCTL